MPHTLAKRAEAEWIHTEDPMLHQVPQQSLHTRVLQERCGQVGHMGPVSLLCITSP